MLDVRHCYCRVQANIGRIAEAGRWIRKFVQNVVSSTSPCFNPDLTKEASSPVLLLVARLDQYLHFINQATENYNNAVPPVSSLLYHNLLLKEGSTDTTNFSWDVHSQQSLGRESVFKWNWLQMLNEVIQSIYNLSFSFMKVNNKRPLFINQHLTALTILPSALHISLVGCPTSSNAFCWGATSSLMNLRTASRNMSWCLGLSKAVTCLHAF